MGEHIRFAEQPVQKPTNGSAGQHTQLPGCATTVSAVAAATGGIRPGNIISTDK